MYGATHSALVLAKQNMLYIDLVICHQGAQYAPLKVKSTPKKKIFEKNIQLFRRDSRCGRVTSILALCIHVLIYYCQINFRRNVENVHINVSMTKMKR